MKVRIKTWRELLHIAPYSQTGNYIRFPGVNFTREMEELLPDDRIIEINSDGEWASSCRLYKITPEMYAIIPAAKEQSLQRFISGDDYAFDVKDIAGLVFKPESISPKFGQMTITFKSSRWQVVDVTKSKFDDAVKILKDWVEAKENR